LVYDTNDLPTQTCASFRRQADCANAVRYLSPMTADNPPPAGGSDQPVPQNSQPHHRSAQDQAIADAISAAEQCIGKARDTADMVTLLAPRGYDAAALQAGLARQGAARDAFNAQPAAVGKASAAKEARDVAGKAAKQDYVDFRGTAQAVFKKDAAARKALGATGAVLEDLQKFVSQAAASYAAADDAAYAAPLAVRGWTTARLSAAHADLPALLARDNEFKAADSKAVASTAARDAAFGELNAWMGEFRKIARLALKNTRRTARRSGCEGVLASVRRGRDDSPSRPPGPGGGARSRTARRAVPTGRCEHNREGAQRPRGDRPATFSAVGLKRGYESDAATHPIGGVRRPRPATGNSPPCNLAIFPLFPMKTESVGFMFRHAGRSIGRAFASAAFLGPWNPPPKIRAGLALAGVLALGGCSTFETMIKEQNGRVAALEKNVSELEARRAAMIETQAKEKEAALKEKHEAELQQVQTMTNQVWAANEANKRNPQQNKSTFLVRQYAELSLGASPKKPDPGFILKTEDELPKFESPEFSEQKIIDALKPYWGQVADEKMKAVATAASLTQIEQRQTAELDGVNKALAAKRTELVETSKKVTAAALAQLEQERDVQKFYQQLVWLFGGAAVLALGAAVFLGMQGNVRMATYAGLAAAAFLGCTYLTIFLADNRWVLWVVFGGGVVCVAGTVILRQGYALRNTQLVGFAGKRAALVRYIQQEMKKTLQNFGLAEGETLDTLDLHEVEQLQDKVVAELEKTGVPVPAFLKE